ncbi:MAG TPA: DNA repair protein RadA [Candidatus Eisenbacteria bacterium]|nr:DNA repair protein RadA [Candidatus Eisenbacteria bacterium]
MNPSSRKPSSKLARVVFACSQCGEDRPRWFGRCPACSAWNTAVERRAEEVAPGAAPHAGAWVAAAAGEAPKPQPLGEVTLEAAAREPTGFGEVDRVLGGGLVPGALLLLCGDPGIGKSTLALQIARALATRRRVLYLSGEESPEQVRLRAERIGASPAELLVLCETDLARALAAAEESAPGILVVDSIQTLAVAEVPAGPGSVAQVRECALGLLHFAKRRRVPVLLVGHVTKDGAAAGPRVLEHMVDAVLYLEGERHHPVRLLRAAKNRFGSTSEIGVFEMSQSGLAEVRDPARAFVGAATPFENPGSVLVTSLAGTRPLVVEVQALVAGSGFAVPQRAGSGVPPKRLAVLLAVIEKRLGVRLSHADVFVNVAGGLRLEEPAADLGLALAIAGSRLDRPARGRLVAIGEIGLAGEVRPVPSLERRVREAALMGYGPVVVPRSQLEEARVEGTEILGAATLAEAVEVSLGPQRRKESAPEEDDSELAPSGSRGAEPGG